jgi:DAK2 domain fusion protein YloV
MATFRDLVHAHAPGINRLNVYPVPDGDTGTNMARTLDAVLTELESAPPTLDATCRAISHGSLMGARGNSGVILSQILRGMASTLQHHGDATAGVVAEALVSASRAAYQAVLVPVEGTILTVARESADAAEGAAAAGATLDDTLRAARDAGRESLARTPDLLPVLRDAGVVDAGGAGLLLLFDAALHVVAGEPLPEPKTSDQVAAGTVTQTVASGRREAEPGLGQQDGQRYEVMFFCDLADARIDELKLGWGAIGDSIVVVGGDGLWNCHVHTNDIGAAIETALDLDGRPRQIRITDLFEEVAAEHAHRDALAGVMAGAMATAVGPSGVAYLDVPAVTCAVVAVSSGEGLTELFHQLGVQAVIAGGQTLNPSTAELLDAVERVNAEQVVVLPNNKNIIPVAEQLDGLTAKKVVVVPTRSMPEGLGALVVYDPEVDADANGEEMGEAAESVATGEVTRAVRASAGPTGPIAAGDVIGLVRGDGIVAAGETVAETAAALLDALVGDDRELVTILTGAEADVETTASITRWLADQRPGVQVEVHRGGQPLYPYLFGVE